MECGLGLAASSSDDAAAAVAWCTTACGPLAAVLW